MMGERRVACSPIWVNAYPTRAEYLAVADFQKTSFEFVSHLDSPFQDSFKENFTIIQNTSRTAAFLKILSSKGKRNVKAEKWDQYLTPSKVTVMNAGAGSLYDHHVDKAIFCL